MATIVSRLQSPDVEGIKDFERQLVIGSFSSSAADFGAIPSDWSKDANCFVTRSTTANSYPGPS